VRGRYAGSLIGLGWVALSPALFLGIYTVVYLHIFRVQAGDLSPLEYVLYVFSGLVPFVVTSEAISVGVGSVVANKSVLTNTVFPIDLVPVKAVLASQPTMVVGFLLVIIGTAAAHRLTWTAVLLPVVWGLHLLALVGLNWILSLLNVIVRDLQTLITAVLMFLLVASPIAYTPDMVPPSLQFLVTANPFAYFVLAYQRLLILGALPSVAQSVVLVVGSCGLFFLGGWFFAGTKHAIADYV
jgi:lipopolysaccharide transport system permease protein